MIGALAIPKMGKPPALRSPSKFPVITIAQTNEIKSPQWVENSLIMQVSIPHGVEEESIMDYTWKPFLWLAGTIALQVVTLSVAALMLGAISSH
ncbi:hypothetical protein NG794_15300 [Laspinema sp. D6]|uniref:Uncharacterized protein n=3 Tax=Laspinema TaxID=2584823 RepID=A0ABT2NF92_9CYAN|nr:hypothetical protein [Laspinema sp. D3b]MCT7989738.1 hypothetical protein [Laspinema sp. D3a]